MSAHPAFLQRREDTDAVNVGQVWAWLSSGDYAYSSQPITYGSLAVGLGAVASHPDGTALGEDACATGDRATAVGTRAEATGHNAVALGADSSASHRNSNSAAIGTDARTTRSNQMMLDTSGTTYTAPGITSAQSRAAQSGPRQLLTTDAAGNLASDGGRTFKRLDEHAAGIAMAVVMQNPGPGGRGALRHGRALGHL